MYRPPRWIAPLLFAPGILWESTIRVRNLLYGSGILPVRGLGCPVISVGNLTLGGTGKTPLVIHLTRLLYQMGVTPVLLTRGYGRRSRLPEIIPPDMPVASPGAQLGDEPALVRRSVPGVWIGVSARRFEAGCRIAKDVPNAVFILDDGFQHRRLRRDLDLLVLDCTQPLVTDRVFPRGNLREPVKEIRRCDAVVINSPDGDDGQLEKAVTQIHPSATVFHCRQRISSIITYADWLEGGSPSSQDQRAPVFLAAAIGNPLRFKRDVAAAGLQVRGTRFYRDHFMLSPHDWRSCWAEARAAGAQYLLTTAKDAVKIVEEPDVPLRVATQVTVISESDAFQELLRRAVKV